MSELDECYCTTPECVTHCERCRTRCAVGTDGVCDHCYAIDDETTPGGFSDE